MKLKTIKLKNFFRYGPNEQSLDLTGNGIVNINGINGVGKSSIFYAIIYALYGKTKQDSVEDVVNRYTGKDCKVSIDFEEDGNQYTVIRYRKHNVHGNSVYIFENDKDITPKNAIDANQKIVDIIKMPYIAFVNSTIFSSELYSAFLGAKESDRLQIFENILSMKEISLFYIEAKNIIKEYNDKRSEIYLKQSSKITEITTLKNTLDNYSAKAKGMLVELKNKKISLESTISEYEKKISEYSSINIEKEKAKILNLPVKQSLANEIEETKKNIIIINYCDDKYKASVSFINKYCGCDFEKAIKDEEEYFVNTKKRNDILSEISKIESNISSVENSLNKENIKKAELKIEEYRKDLSALLENKCPHCHQTLNKEFVEKDTKDYNEKINSLNDDIAVFKQEDEKNSSILLNLNKELGNKKADLLNIESLLNVSIINDAKLIKEQYNSALEYAKSFDERVKEIGENNLKLSNKINELNEKMSKLELPEYTEDFINGIEKEISKLNEGIQSCKDQINAINGSVNSVYDKEYADKISGDIAAKEEEEKKIEKAINLLDEEIRYYTFLSENFSNKSGGFKKYFIGEMIDVFNEKINEYLPFFFTENVRIIFDKDLKESIVMDEMPATFSSFSRGQKTRAELAVAFALFALSRIFFSNDNSLLVVDEILDSGLDEYGIKSAISVLKGFADEAKIFVVSHNPVVKENIDVSVEIKKDENGFSVIA